MKKNFVLDTNVLLYDPRAIFKFEDNNVVVPITVIEETDHFKRNVDEIGRNARQVSRYLDEYRQKGSLAKGVELPSGGLLSIDIGGDVSLLPKSMIGKKEDNIILSTALKLHKEQPDVPVIFVTKDSNLRIKADALGLRSEDFESDVHVQIDELYRGYRTIEVDAGMVAAVNSDQAMDAPADDMSPNEYAILTDAANAENIALSRLDPESGKLTKINEYPDGVWGIFPRNIEQRLAFDMLMDPRVPLVTMVGKAGTGKTLISLAAGLSMATDEEMYQRLLVSRPVFPMGRDLGFLPGDVQDKMRPWMQPIFDNVDLLLHIAKGKGDGGGKDKNDGQKSKAYQELEDMGILQIEALTYIRGRSIPNQYMIVDEAQNLSPHEVKTIITRAGEDTKIILTGDPYQIDSPYLDSRSNGLTFAVQKFRGQTLAGHMFLEKGERSPLAELAANIL